MTDCPWWIRWWHRRRRLVDHMFVYRKIARSFHPPETIREMWDIFIHLPGQDHWRCPCARHADGATVERMPPSLTLRAHQPTAESARCPAGSGSSPGRRPLPLSMATVVAHIELPWP